MSISSQISITEDSATPAIAELMAKVSPARLAQVVRAPLRAFWRDRLKKYPRLDGRFAGFPSTGFGEEAADSVEAFAGDGTVLLRADRIGLRAQYTGATIRPVNKKFLCFGITPETYGKSYAEFAANVSWRKNFSIVTGPRGGKKKVFNRNTTSETKNELKGKFAFARQVTLRANLEIVPTQDEFAEVAFAAIERSLAE
jgi:hypothetical protein